MSHSSVQTQPVLGQGPTNQTTWLIYTSKRPQTIGQDTQETCSFPDVLAKCATGMWARVLTFSGINTTCTRDEHTPSGPKLNIPRKAAWRILEGVVCKLAWTLMLQSPLLHRIYPHNIDKTKRYICKRWKSPVETLATRSVYSYHNQEGAYRCTNIYQAAHADS